MNEDGRNGGETYVTYKEEDPRLFLSCILWIRLPGCHEIPVFIASQSPSVANGTSSLISFSSLVMP